jgi:hypothetical protein
MKDIEDIRNNIDALTQLVRIIAMSESNGMSYTHEEVEICFQVSLAPAGTDMLGYGRIHRKYISF